MPAIKNLLPSHYHRLAPFQSYFRHGTPMLMYHAVARAPRGTRYRGLFYPADHFHSQIRQLHDAGFQTCEPSEANTEYLGDQRICLTFDDGFASLYDSALRALTEVHFASTVFIVTDLIGRTNSWDSTTGVAQCRLMNDAQITEWLGEGQRIGSHTCNHVHLPHLSIDQAREEITSSKKKLEDRFGVKVVDFAYPYGQWTQREADLVEEAGYATACTTRFGLNDARTASYALRRITVRKPVLSWKSFRKWLARRMGTDTGRLRSAHPADAQ